jgi:hypothetical protein
MSYYFHTRPFQAVWALLCTLFWGASFAMFGVIYKLTQPLIEARFVEPFGQLFKIDLWLLMAAAFCIMVYYLFRTLDETFYAPNERRRITGTRKVPPHARRYKVTWRESACAER